jgi:transcriptional regulator with XRE-family HTH domain
MIGSIIKQARTASGLTQSELAGLAAISLATIQNIEAQKANPSFTTLEKLLFHLGLKFSIEPQRPNWDYISKVALPFGPKVATLDVGFFVHQLRLAAEQTWIDASPREVEALQVLFIVLRQHFPALVKKELRIINRRATEGPLTGRQLKLRRQILQKLGGLI